MDGPAGRGLIEPSYLKRSDRVLPSGWNIYADADGDLAYERLQPKRDGDVVLFDGDGLERRFTSTGTGFKPPPNEDGVLIRNADGVHTLTDTDGRVYIFNVDGTLRETTGRRTTGGRRP